MHGLRGIAETGVLFTRCSALGEFVTDTCAALASGGRQAIAQRFINGTSVALAWRCVDCRSCVPHSAPTNLCRTDLIPSASSCNSLRSWRMTGRDGTRRATALNPARVNADMVPVNTLDVLPARVVSTGYASTAGARARLASFNAAAINADMTPCLR